jgi:chitodextrinase
VTTVTPPDTQPPAAITTLAVTDSAQTTLTLRWLAPSDPPNSAAASQYEMRRWTDGGSWNSGAAVPGLPSPAAPGTQQSVLVSGLAASTRYHFQIRSRDAAGNNAPLSNEAAGRTLTPPDTLGACVADLHAADSTRTSVTFAWTAPGDPPHGTAVAGYEARLWTAGGAWETGTEVPSMPEPAAPGSAQTVTVEGLSPAACYEFAVRTRDLAGNACTTPPVAACTAPLPADSDGPATVADLVALAASPTSLTLRWTSPADRPSGRSAAYDVRMLPEEGGWEEGAPLEQASTPASPGLAESLRVEALQPATTYRFALKARDAAGNWSAASNTAQATTPAPPDEDPPFAVTDLLAVAGASDQVLLTWSAPADAPGGGPAAGYDVRWWAEGGSWEAADGTAAPAPLSPGSPESLRVGGLAAAETYSFAVASRDGLGHVSSLSNIASATTEAAPDEEAPEAIVDLSVESVTDTSASLAWTAPADPPLRERVHDYEIQLARTGDAAARVFRLSSDPGHAPVDPGERQSVLITGLDPSVEYVATVRSLDTTGNLSLPSNAVEFRTRDAADTQPPDDVTDLSAVALGESAIRLRWTAPADPPRGEAVAAYETRWWEDGESWDSGAPVPGMLDPAAPGQMEEIVLDGLRPGTAYVFALRAADAAGNFSGLSNEAAAHTEEPADTQPPSAPAAVTASLVDGRVDVRWDPAPEADVVGYNVYRRRNDDASAALLAAAPADATSHTDFETPTAPVFYSVTSVDGAGNESAASLESRVDPPAPPGGIPAPPAAPYPNPFRDSTTFFVPLAPGDEIPSVRVYTIVGRFVRELRADRGESGGITIRWDGRLADGTRASCGVYLCRIGGAHPAWRRVDLLR